MKITNAKYEMSGKQWERVSKEAKDLIKHLLQKDPKIRYTPFQVIAHTWITNVALI